MDRRTDGWTNGQGEGEMWDSEIGKEERVTDKQPVLLNENSNREATEIIHTLMDVYMSS